MANYILDGRIKVLYVASIADTSAPTDDELDAGIDLTPYLRGLSTPLDGSTADASDADSKFNQTTAGTFGGQPLTITLKRDSDQGEDTAWSTLPRETTGNIVVCRRGGSGTDGVIAATDHVDVWSAIEVITRNPMDYARNTVDVFDVACSVNAEPDEDVTVAAAA